MRRLVAVLAALLSLTMWIQWQWPAPASASTLSDQLAKSAGQKWALLNVGNGKYVSAPDTGSGGDYAKLYASATSITASERFTLHTDDKGSKISLRAESNGMFVSADDNNSEKLRAQGDHIGSWEGFTLKYQGSDTDGAYYALHSENANAFVTAELGSYPDYEVLRARSASVGSWEKFRLVPVTDSSNHVGAVSGDYKQWGTPPAPSAPTSTSVKVMTWNLCGDQNPDCVNKYSTPDHMAAQVIGQLNDVGSTYTPDALFFEESCEKFAKPIEAALESRTGTGWDVRFAPIYYNVSSTGGGAAVLAQKECADATGFGDRGAYGVSVAVPDENTWYRANILNSPATALDSSKTSYPVEQRAALCAAITSKAVMYCGAHFSTGGTNYDDPDWTYHADQLSELTTDEQIAKDNGYRAVFGGDLNVNPPARGWDGYQVLNPVYGTYRECAQLQDANSARDGQNTTNSSKIDYIFGAGHTACAVSANTWGSDHHALRSTTLLP
ncbi:endonuclease/exonuclease/phosphatase family protein (plasmid) [Streptomyces hygroscopicus subsp. jinggangensis 5008]|nr:endonuclease/exonuclease/phosphatase family protein [Streptomyces hygroscopicus subsp. jinggangensis 5008]AGF68420.1 endonuclease/exonuclease/phosphatase family protein [Streptomyces hygroscopicus subsp. jinggangensis TL01]